jgi:pimeloyl-ACP methyl ester carboxylesterase
MAILIGVMALLAAVAPAAAAPPVKYVALERGRLAYVETGRGEPLVLVHGGMQDYRFWAPHMAALGKHFHVIAYSRRNHYPNDISAEGWADTAADLHAHDLAALIAALRLGPVNLVAHSSGAHAALFFVDQHPELVRTLVVNEPPASGLLASDPAVGEVGRAFNTSLGPSREAFKAGDLAAGVRLFTDAVSGPGAFEQRSAEQKAMLMDNAVAHQVDAISSRPRPVYTCEMARRISVPVLITNGQRSPAFFHAVTDELARCIGHAKRASFPASHGVPQEAPAEFDDAVLSFLAPRSPG